MPLNLKTHRGACHRCGDDCLMMKCSTAWQIIDSLLKEASLTPVTSHLPSTYPSSIQHCKPQSASPAFPLCPTENENLTSNYTYKTPECWSSQLTVFLPGMLLIL